jgi:hypothetical protein
MTEITGIEETLYISNAKPMFPVFWFPRDTSKVKFFPHPLSKLEQICYQHETTLHWYSHLAGFRKGQCQSTLDICRQVRLLFHKAMSPFPFGISCAIF